jgi:sulfur-carrier protein
MIVGWDNPRRRPAAKGVPVTAFKEEGGLMTVRVRLFAAARDVAGRGEDTVSAGPLTDVLGTLEERYGERFAAVLSVATVLVDGSAVGRDAPVAVPDGAEVAILPPFSGGAHRTLGCGPCGST